MRMPRHGGDGIVVSVQQGFQCDCHCKGGGVTDFQTRFSRGIMILHYGFSTRVVVVVVIVFLILHIIIIIIICVTGIERGRTIVSIVTVLRGVVASVIGKIPQANACVLTAGCE